MKNRLRRGGFTVIEMTTSMVIMLIVTGAIFMVSNDSWTITRQMEIQTDALESSRVANDTVNRNLTGASNLGDFLPDEFVNGAHAGHAKGTELNYVYFSKPSAFDALGEPTEYDFLLYYLTNKATLRTVGGTPEYAYDLREYRVRRVAVAQLPACFTSATTEAAILALSPSATFSDRLVVSGIDGETDGSGNVGGFLFERTLTRLAAASVAGSTTLSVASVANFDVGDEITVEDQTYTVSAVNDAVNPKTITTSQTIRRNHALNAPVTNMTDSVTLELVTAKMGRKSEGIARVPVTTRIFLRNS